MNHPHDIIHHGLQQARLALWAVRPRTGLTLATPTPLPEGTEILTFPDPYRFALSGRVRRYGSMARSPTLRDAVPREWRDGLVA